MDIKLVNTGTLNNKCIKYPTSRICCICNKYEYPESDTCTTATWICDDCLQKIKKLLEIEVC